MEKFIFIPAFLIAVSITLFTSTDKYPLDPKIAGRRPPKAIIDCLTPVKVGYIDFEGRDRKGVLIVNKDLAKGVKRIFRKIKQIKFPIEKISPVSNYDWDDEKSMQANNTSSYNYRNMTGSTKLSTHAIGCAIDINPRLNPFVKLRADLEGKFKYNQKFFKEDDLDISNKDVFVEIHPINGVYTKNYQRQKGTVIPGHDLGDKLIKIFADEGWTVWGGNWNSIKDWQHFQHPGCNRNPILKEGESYCDL